MWLVAQRQEIRPALPEREGNIAATAVRDHVTTAHGLYGLRLVLGDAPLIVLHQPSGH